MFSFFKSFWVWCLCEVLFLYTLCWKFLMFWKCININLLLYFFSGNLLLYLHAEPNLQSSQPFDCWNLQNLMHWQCFQRGSVGVGQLSAPPYLRMFCPWRLESLPPLPQSINCSFFLAAVAWPGTLSPVGLYVYVYWAQPIYSVLCIYVLLRQ